MINNYEILNILILNYEYPPLGGGAGNATRYLLQEFAHYPNLQITLVTSSTTGFRVDRPAENITIYFLDIGKRGSLHYQHSHDLLRYTRKAWRFSRKLVKQYEFDLVHAFFGIPCGLIAWNLSLPYIVSLRGSDVPYYNRRFYWWDKLILKRLHGLVWRKAAKVIANSQGLQELALQSFPEQAINVIPNGVDTNLFYPGKERPIDGTLKIFSVGRLIERKGFDLLIEALSGLANVTLTLAGEGQELPRLQALAQKHNVKVTFLGRVDHSDLPEYYRQADLFVLPSRNEGMPNAALEAMASGLPLILTDTGGAVELVQGNGKIAQKNDVKAIRAAIIDYIQNPGLIHNHSQASKNLVKTMSWGKIAASYISIYQQLGSDK